MNIFSFYYYNSFRLNNGKDTFQRTLYSDTTCQHNYRIRHNIKKLFCNSLLLWSADCMGRPPFQCGCRRLTLRLIPRPLAQSFRPVSPFTASLAFSLVFYVYSYHDGISIKTAQRRLWAKGLYGYAA